MRSSVKIRVDGGRKIGIGHLVRCISLAHMLSGDFEIKFYVKIIPDNLKREILKEGWTITILDREDEFIDFIGEEDLVVLDGYQFDSSYQKRIKEKGTKLICIDDLYDQYFYADIVINQAPGVTEEMYQGESYTKYLLGPEYALLRPEFFEPVARKFRSSINENNRLFICFGGSDDKNMTSKILKWLPKNNYKVSVVVGSSYAHWEKLKNVIAKRDDLEIEVKRSLTAKEMREEMINADLGIVPSSGILFEAISTGLPVITGYIADNQKGFYDGFKVYKHVIGVNNFKRNKLISALKKIENPDNQYESKTDRFNSKKKILNALKFSEC